MKHLEDLIQQNIVNAVRLNYPKSLIYSVPNGGKRNLIEAKRLKRTGTLAGASDLIFLFENKVIFVEVKTEKGIQSIAQKDFKKKVEALGHQYWIVRSANEMLEKIKDYKY